MPLGASGKHYFNPKVMEHKGDMPEEGHHSIHHIEIHPHGPSSEHPHHVEIHHHDGQMTHGGEHENYDQAAAAGKEHMDGGGEEPETGEQEEEPEMKHNMGSIRRADSGAY